MDPFTLSERGRRAYGETRVVLSSGNRETGTVLEVPAHACYAFERERTQKYVPVFTIGKTLKKDLLQQISEGVGSLANVQMFAVATLRDHRFKFAFHDDEKTPLRVSNAVCTLWVIC